MSRFLQFHFLTVYPPSNPNRDDQGRPKNALYGGVSRLRISSQALKRAARQAEIMKKGLEGNMGDRTQRLGDEIVDHLMKKGAPQLRAVEIAKEIAAIFGKIDDKNTKEKQVRILQLAFISPDEWKLAFELVEKALNGEALPKEKDLAKLVFRKADGAVDIAMFGRMLASDPEYNREAAVQVSHAITTHKAVVEDDFYTAADDLKEDSEDAGAGFVGDAGFGSGVYYLYACVDCDLLIENLSGDQGLAQKAVSALVEALATATPSGKKNSFAHQTRAAYIRAEYGNQQPRSLAGAFFKPIEDKKDHDLLPNSINALENMVKKIDNAYDAAYEGEPAILNILDGTGSLKEIKEFVEARVSNG